jgi:hypothetical protein
MAMHWIHSIDLSIGSWRSLANSRLMLLQEIQLAAILEILQSIRQSDMSPVLSRIYKSDGGSEALDTLMKYMYVVPFIP